MKYNAFSLVELIVTVAIVALLSAVAVPAYNSYLARAKIAPALSSISNLSAKIEEFYDKNGVMPTTMMQIGYNSPDSTYPSAANAGPDFATSTSEYAVPPNLISMGFGGTSGIPGECPQFGIGSYISNYDSTGALTTSNTEASNIFVYYSYILTGSGSWQVFCQAAEPNNINDSDYSNLIPGCFNMATGFGSTEIINALNSCP